MENVAYREQSTDIVIANDNDANSLPGLIRRAARTLESATSAAEVLEAKEHAGFAYDAAKRAARIAKAKGAHDELIAKVHRAQADALELEAMAKRRLADEYDAAQERGEVAIGRPKKSSEGEDFQPTVTDIGLTHKEIHEARQIRDAERGEVRGANTGRSVSALETPSFREIGLSGKEIHEARQIRDAEQSSLIFFLTRCTFLPTRNRIK